MAGIGPISGISTSIGAAGLTTPAKAAAAPETSFGNVLKTYVENVNSNQQQATQAVGDLMSGQEGDVLPAVTAMAKADLSFKLLLGVRNKVIDAYKQTMNMQI
jgi:flagellar hook-basal body complex protein FliE